MAEDGIAKVVPCHVDLVNDGMCRLWRPDREQPRRLGRLRQRGRPLRDPVLCR